MPSPSTLRTTALLLLSTAAFTGCGKAPEAEVAPKPLVTEEVVVPEVDLSEDVTEKGPPTIDPETLERIPPGGHGDDDDR